MISFIVDPNDLNHENDLKRLLKTNLSNI